MSSNAETIVLVGLLVIVTLLSGGGLFAGLLCEVAR